MQRKSVLLAVNENNALIQVFNLNTIYFINFERMVLMKKRFISILLTMIFVLSAAGQGFAAIPGYTKPAKPIKVFINGVEQKLTLPIYAYQGRNYYPFRELCEKVGATVTYNEKTKSAEATLNGNTVSFPVGKDYYYLNGVKMSMDGKTVGDPDTQRTYIPIRYAMEAFGFDVKWLTGYSYNIIRIANPAPSEREDILLQLHAYPDNLQTYYKDNSRYMPNSELMAKENENINIYGPVALQKKADLIKSFMEVENNVDYRTIDDKYINSYKFYFQPNGNDFYVYELEKELSTSEYIQNRINDIKTYKIASKAEFITDKTLIYCSKDGERRVRGRLKIMFTSVDPKYFAKYKMKPLKLNKWYYMDVEIAFAYVAYDPYGKDKWEHSPETYTSLYKLTDFIEVK